MRKNWGARKSRESVGGETMTKYDSIVSWEKIVSGWKIGSDCKWRMRRKKGIMSQGGKDEKDGRKWEKEENEKKLGEEIMIHCV